jgi:hypothetical protein
MNPHASPTSGLTWEDGVIPYSSLVQTLQEATANFPHLHSKGIESFRFLPLYSMNPHASPTSGLTWNDGVIPYSSLVQTLQEATANIPNLHSKGDAKCRNLSTLLGRSVQNLDSFGCAERSEFKMAKGCIMTCHKFPDKSCALRNASNLYGWLMHHIQDK